MSVSQDGGGGSPQLTDRVQGHPGGGCKGACVVFLALLPAGGLAVERCLKEMVSKRGQRAVCPHINPPGFRSER
ncbi:hypothetical protein VT03_29630 [Planctomyces sp. SH-PL14]|nr:hypothetical protein VT03_29630 [Planctomyces sp. SH-PL14]